MSTHHARCSGCGYVYSGPQQRDGACHYVLGKKPEDPYEVKCGTWVAANFDGPQAKSKVKRRARARVAA